ncbi:MAG: transcriptional repressor [Epsilonproteobacteria bacterium]|nr:transcriptional repressor [Campylobacterota bacterium]
MNAFTDILRKHSLKATPQRLTILQIISKYGHINIDTLYSKTKDQFSSISLATIYKNINSMIEVGILDEVKLPNAKSVYEVVKESHAHLKCETCGNIEDMNIDTNNIFSEISQQHHFKINHSDVVLSGICQNCL